MRRLSALLLLLALATSAVTAAEEADAPPPADPAAEAPASAGDETAESTPPSRRRGVAPAGERGRALEAARARQRAAGGYRRWKMRLPFWPRKLLIFSELAVIIVIGIFAGQMLEVSGLMRYLAIIAWPLLRLGRLPRQTAPAFVMAFQSGAVANSMLVNYRDSGDLDNRELYTSVLVVSCLSLFAHLPTYVPPFLAVVGASGTLGYFGVRLAAILIEIVLVLIVSRWLIAPWLRRRAPDADATAPTAPTAAAAAAQIPARHAPREESGSFWRRVWRRSRKTIRRLLTYLAPTFFLTCLLEYYDVFDWLADQAPSVFELSFLPPEAAAVIPAQAVNLYNGLMVAANYLDAGAVTLKEVVVTLLVGSLVTAPFRTLKHALPTYLAILGARPGTVLAVSAQVLRCLMVAGCTVALVYLW
jgi:hypothetical protein